MNDTQTTAEHMAALVHDVWVRWMVYMLSKCANTVDGDIVIPAYVMKRWHRQMNTAYADLPESEKQSDKDIAAEYMACIDRRPKTPKPPAPKPQTITTG